MTIRINKRFLSKIKKLQRYYLWFIILGLSGMSVMSFTLFYLNKLGLAYNDARSHLDIGRRVVEGLKPGFSQLGSVWLPLPHILMLPTIWNDFMWHSGLAGALISMISFVGTGTLIYYYLRKLGVNVLGRLVGIGIFALNLNVLYLQSTAMTELLLIVTMTAGAYELLRWHIDSNLYTLIKVGFFVFLTTLIRYDGWFFFLFASGLVVLQTIRKNGYKHAEGLTILFCTLAGFGIFLWFLWNQLIFNDALYFALGPYSARTQQQQLDEAGILSTKGNFFYSLRVYLYAMAYNSGLVTLLLATAGAVLLWFDKKLSVGIRVANTALLSPLIFNVIALYFGHSVLFVQGLSGSSWFNVRYGVLMIPSIAIYTGYLIYRVKSLRLVLIGLLFFVTVISTISQDIVALDDARVGSSGKNVTEVSGWLKQHAGKNNNYILLSAASHDAIIFSSGLPMKRFIHEGTGKYWEAATEHPEEWARYIIMRTGDVNDMTNRLISNKKGFTRYIKMESFPFADIYEIKPEFITSLHIDTPFAGQK